MSARREKRLRKLEARVAYLESRTYSVEMRQLRLEELAASPTMTLSTDTEKDHHRGVLASLLLRLRGGYATTKDIKRSYKPPRTFS